MGKIILSVFFCILFPAYAIAEVNLEASKSADTFLRAVRIIELTEGKQMLADVTWGLDNDFPVFTESSTLFETMFNTDDPGVSGYKRVLEVKGISKASTQLFKKYLLIAYKDRISQNWKVFSLREIADAEYEAQESAKMLNETRFTTKSVNYRGYGYWLMMAGKIRQAYDAFKQASESNRINPSKYSTQEEFDVFVKQVGKMLSP